MKRTGLTLSRDAAHWLYLLVHNPQLAVAANVDDLEAAADAIRAIDRAARAFGALPELPPGWERKPARLVGDPPAPAGGVNGSGR